MKDLQLIRRSTCTRFTSIAAGMVLLLTGTVTTTASASNIIMHPAGCQAPFLSQAGPMRWHEHYLMNPASNISTFVICPLTFDDDLVTFTAGFGSFIDIAGAIQNGAASQSPVCFFAAAASDNLNLDPYITMGGGGRTFIQPLSTSLSFPLWESVGTVSHDAIIAATGTPNPVYWNVALFCQLPPGYALSTLHLEQ